MKKLLLILGLMLHQSRCSQLQVGRSPEGEEPADSFDGHFLSDLEMALPSNPVRRSWPMDNMMNDISVPWMEGTDNAFRFRMDPSSTERGFRIDEHKRGGSSSQALRQLYMNWMMMRPEDYAAKGLGIKRHERTHPALYEPMNRNSREDGHRYLLWRKITGK